MHIFESKYDSIHTMPVVVVETESEKNLPIKLDASMFVKTKESKALLEKFVTMKKRNASIKPKTVLSSKIYENAQRNLG
jgi:hypothetical protein